MLEMRVNKTKDRIWGLDLIRAFSILCVVFEHGYFSWSDGKNKPLYQLFIIDGVSFFFVLSGFLVGKILINQLVQGFGVVQLTAFLKKRWRRTLPTYYLILVILLLSFHLIHHYDWKNSISYFVFIQNLYFPHPNFFGEAWSLAVEEWFYLIFSTLLFATRLWFKNTKWLILFWIGVFMLFSIFTRLRLQEMHIIQDIEAWHEWIRKPVFSRMDAIMMGVLGSYLAIFYAKFWSSIRNCAFVLGLGFFIALRWFVFPNANFSIFFNTLYPIGEAISILLLFPLLSNLNIATENIFTKSVQYISIISYSMYLVNWTLVNKITIPLLNSMAENNLHHSLTHYEKYALHWVLTILIASILYYTWENRWMKKN